MIRTSKVGCFCEQSFEFLKKFLVGRIDSWGFRDNNDIEIGEFGGYLFSQHLSHSSFDRISYNRLLWNCRRDNDSCPRMPQCIGPYPNCASSQWNRSAMPQDRNYFCIAMDTKLLWKHAFFILLLISSAPLRADASRHCDRSLSPFSFENRVFALVSAFLVDMSALAYILNLWIQM